MGNLYLVRHGQASLGADDYDQLSELGHRQTVRLGAYFAHQGLTFDGLITGTLKRHRQTLAGILEGLGPQAARAAGEPLAWPGLNEYDSAAVIAAVHPQPLGKPNTPEAYRHHFRVLREGLTQWAAGQVNPRGMPTYEAFVAGVTGALDHVRAHHAGRNVLIVSSGGVSVGEEDHLKAAIQAEGELKLWKLAIKPGKPLAFGRVNRPEPCSSQSPCRMARLRNKHDE
jgi:broad specificity phosphatase PhoE